MRTSLAGRDSICTRMWPRSWRRRRSCPERERHDQPALRGDGQLVAAGDQHDLTIRPRLNLGARRQHLAAGEPAPLGLALRAPGRGAVGVQHHPVGHVGHAGAVEDEVAGFPHRLCVVEAVSWAHASDQQTPEARHAGIALRWRAVPSDDRQSRVGVAATESGGEWQESVHLAAPDVALRAGGCSTWSSMPAVSRSNLARRNTADGLSTTRGVAHRRCASNAPNPLAPVGRSSPNPARRLSPPRPPPRGARLRADHPVGGDVRPSLWRRLVQHRGRTLDGTVRQRRSRHRWAGAHLAPRSANAPVRWSSAFRPEPTAGLRNDDQLDRLQLRAGCRRSASCTRPRHRHAPTGRRSSGSTQAIGSTPAPGLP